MLLVVLLVLLLEPISCFESITKARYGWASPKNHVTTSMLRCRGGEGKDE